MINKEIQALINKVGKRNYRTNYTITNANLVPPVELKINGEFFTVTMAGVTPAQNLRQTSKPRKIEVNKEFQRKLLTAMGWSFTQQ
jgi:hypothetical protein